MADATRPGRAAGLMRGAAWSAVEFWTQQGAALLTFIAVGNLIGPAAVGVLMVGRLVVTLMMSLLLDGFSDALIQHQELEPGHFATAFRLLTSCGLATALVLWAPALAALFAGPELSHVLPLLAIGLPFAGIGAPTRGCCSGSCASARWRCGPWWRRLPASAARWRWPAPARYFSAPWLRGLFACHEGSVTEALDTAAMTQLWTLVGGLRTALAMQVESWRGIVLWGLGSKGVCFLSTLGGEAAVSHVVDINPHRQGRFMAGTGHPIVGPEALRTLRPHTAIGMNALYVPEIEARLAGMWLQPEALAL